MPAKFFSFVCEFSLSLSDAFFCVQNAFHVSQKTQNQASWREEKKASIPLELILFFFYLAHIKAKPIRNGDGEESAKRLKTLHLIFFFGFMIFHCDLRSTSFLLLDAFLVCWTKNCPNIIFFGEHKNWPEDFCLWETMARCGAIKLWWKVVNWCFDRVELLQSCLFEEDLKELKSKNTSFDGVLDEICLGIAHAHGHTAGMDTAHFTKCVLRVWWNLTQISTDSSLHSLLHSETSSGLNTESCQFSLIWSCVAEA